MKGQKIYNWVRGIQFICHSKTQLEERDLIGVCEKSIRDIQLSLFVKWFNQNNHPQLSEIEQHRQQEALFEELYPRESTIDIYFEAPTDAVNQYKLGVK